MERLPAGILIGGASRRMGRPKHLLELGGHSFLERAVDALSPRAGEIVLLGSGEVPEALSELRRLADAPGLAGPLAGILAAMRWRPDAAWIIAACDQPLISAAAVDWLLGERRPEAWAVMPRGEGGVEPLLAVYEPAARELLEELAVQGRLGPSALAGHAGVLSPVPPAELARAWRSVNTPEDILGLEEKQGLAGRIRRRRS
ncbi:MAG: molybdenum cofactor guanylyltransferase [Candidatus Eiseniibacteriota bacterium]